MKCSICNTENEASAHFCKHCGVTMIQSSAIYTPNHLSSGTCTQCGHGYTMPARFCSVCGVALPATAQRAPAAAVPLASTVPAFSGVSAAGSAGAARAINDPLRRVREAANVSVAERPAGTTAPPAATRAAASSGSPARPARSIVERVTGAVLPMPALRRAGGTLRGMAMRKPAVTGVVLLTLFGVALSAYLLLTTFMTGGRNLTAAQQENLMQRLQEEARMAAEVPAARNVIPDRRSVPAPDAAPPAMASGNDRPAAAGNATAAATTPSASTAQPAPASSGSGAPTAGPTTASAARPVHRSARRSSQPSESRIETAAVTPSPVPSLVPPPAPPMPPPQASAPARSSGARTGGWHRALVAQMQSCAGDPNLLSRVICTERAKFRYCNPNHWGQVGECVRNEEKIMGFSQGG